MGVLEERLRGDLNLIQVVLGSGSLNFSILYDKKSAN